MFPQSHFDRADDDPDADEDEEDSGDPDSTDSQNLVDHGEESGDYSWE